MSKSLTVFILSAGYGTRLRPLTNRIPKPLIPFQGKSAFKINWEMIGELKPERIICNSHYLPELIRSQAEALNIEVVHEPEILGTGGCITNIRELLKETEYFLIHNADILHDMNLNDFIKEGIKTGAVGYLAGINSGKINTLVLDDRSFLKGVENYNGFKGGYADIRLTYSGIALYHRDFLHFCLEKPADIKEFWTSAINDSQGIFAGDYSSSNWFDFGNPEGLWKAAKWYMTKTGNFSFKYPNCPHMRPYVSNECELENLPNGLKNVLIYEFPENESLDNISNSIIGKDFHWDLAV